MHTIHRTSSSLPIPSPSPSGKGVAHGATHNDAASVNLEAALDTESDYQSSSSENTILRKLILHKDIWRADPEEACTQGASSSNPHSSHAQGTSLATGTIPFGAPEIDTVLPEGGLAHHAVHELFYRDPLQPSAVACTLASILAYNAYASSTTSVLASDWHHLRRKENTSPTIMWIGSRCWPTPVMLSSYQTLCETHFLTQCLFINPPNDKTTLWAIETALRSRAIRLVIACCPRISRSTTQRLALAARSHKSTAILLRHIDDIDTPTHALSRWVTAPTPSTNGLPSWNLALHKYKGLRAQHSSWCISLRDTWCTDYTKATSSSPYSLLCAATTNEEKTDRSSDISTPLYPRAVASS